MFSNNFKSVRFHGFCDVITELRCSTCLNSLFRFCAEQYHMEISKIEINYPIPAEMKLIFKFAICVNEEQFCYVKELAGFVSVNIESLRYLSLAIADFVRDYFNVMLTVCDWVLGHFTHLKTIESR